MNRNDKIIVLFGVIILVLASFGVYYWMPKEAGPTTLNVKELSQFCGVFSSKADTIIVSDSNPFYPLITTPLAIHYDVNGNQSVAPLYVENFDEPSEAVIRAMDMIGVPLNGLIVTSGSSKEVSLDVAREYWESSKVVILIEDNQDGYELGVLATPLASYLSAPVIVTNETDSNVIRVLQDLGVEYSLVCGNLEGYGNTLNFDSVDDVLNLSINLIEEKFGNINYVTLTNPVDAWPPKVVENSTVEYDFAPITIKSQSQDKLSYTALGMITGGTTAVWPSFKIPDDYKYALVKFEGVNHDIDDVDTLGDYVTFSCGVDLPDVAPGLQQYELFTGGTASGGIAKRDASGKLISDTFYQEMVLYDRGGASYTVTATGSWGAKKQGTVSGHVTIQKLESPVYPMMKGLSSMAPYLTAYHKGIVFGKPEFAFTANDDVINNQGKTCPGYYVPRRNMDLIPISNKHVYDEIHVPLNNLLAKIAGITLEKDIDLKGLRDYYANNPAYIALVGDATVLPVYYYEDKLEPFGDYWVGPGGDPCDLIYGNIDPIPYDNANIANDIFTQPYPYVENIVGRVTGWDAQDVSALIARTVFYNDIIKNMDEWKNSAGVLIGDGQDFQKPLVRYFIIGDLLHMTARGEPMKLWTGYGQTVCARTVNMIEDTFGFNVQSAFGAQASRVGLSDEAINKLKKATLVNKIFFSKLQVKRLIGEGNVNGGDIMESSNFLFVNGHGCQYLFAMAGNDVTAAGFGGPLIHAILKQTIVPALDGFIGPGGALADIGTYNTRSVADMKFGPSFMWLESCICGKLDGINAKNSLAQAFMHAGVNALVASPTGTNIGGGYLEPKNRMYDLPGHALLSYIKTKINEKKGIYPEPHFGIRIYTDLCAELKADNCSIGLALRDARNKYLPEDADWTLWWSPPLIYTGNAVVDSQLNAQVSSGLGSQPSTMMESKYTSYEEYMLYGDPAFNPYEPGN